MTNYRLHNRYHPQIVYEYRGKGNGLSESEIARQIVSRGLNLSQWLWAEVGDDEGNHQQVIWEWEHGGPVMRRRDIFHAEEYEGPQLWYIGTYLRGRLDDGLFCPFKAAEALRDQSEPWAEHEKLIDQLVKESPKHSGRWGLLVRGHRRQSLPYVCRTRS